MGIEVTYETIRDQNDKAEVIYQHSQPKRHELSAKITREIMKQKIEEWKSITGISASK